MNQLTRYFLPTACFLLLTVFFLLLPDLRGCDLGTRERKPNRLTRFDALAMAVLTLVYGVVAFARLGDRSAPQTFVNMEGREAELTLDTSGGTVSHLMLYTGVGIGGYDITYTTDGSDGYDLARFEQSHAEDLKWQDVDISYYLTGGTIRIRGWGNVWLGEVAALTEDNQRVALLSEDEALCDEQELVPEKQNFMNSSYFDEIYHARTAWEHLHGVWPYEITHPPLGKELMGMGILLFGMTPFGWRFSGTLFGVLMLPLLYVFLKKLFGGRWIPSLGMLLWASDFMHYVQTRIATIDTYSVFFILLMYLFMYLWLTEDKLWALALSGVSFGLGAAAKWTSIYAGAGLALLWAAKWIWRFVEAYKRPVGAGVPDGPQRRKPSPASPHSEFRIPNSELLPAFLLNVLFCLVFFIAVPVLIYYFSYLPYGRAAGYSPFSKDYAAMVWHNQVYMFTYHSNSVLGATHPYSSNWYHWLIDYRPILYVLEYPTPGLRSTIGAFLNPVLCWGGLLSLPVLCWMAIRRRDRLAAFILVGYLSQLLPWVPVERLTFAYHYFPSALFLVLSLSYTMALLRENRGSWRVSALSLTAGSIALFVLFFPVLNGLPVKSELADALLKWLPSWPF